MKKISIKRSKNPVVQLLFMTAILVFLSGCSNKDVPPATTDNSIVNQENDSPQTNTPKVENEQITEAPIVVEPKLHERLHVWDDFYKKYDNYYSAIQIEDMFFYPGMMGAELFNTIENGADTLNEAIAKRKDVSGLILHSDQGFQYTSYEYKAICESNGITISMARKGTPIDDSPIESWHSLLKKETLYNNNIISLENYIELVEEWIEFYNTTRIKGKKVNRKKGYKKNDK